jgi:hypothetical protein
MKSSNAIPRSVGISIILCVVTACVYWLFFVAPVKTGGEAVDHLKKFFDGTITVNKTIVIKASSDLTEVVVREENVNHTYEVTNSWFMSKKKIVLQGDFRCKVGYDFTNQAADLGNPFGLDISDDGKTISVRMPRPSVLSVEMTNYKIVEDENGFWNKITKEDRENAVNELQRGARAELEKSSVLDEVDDEFIRKIKNSFGVNAPWGLQVKREIIP